MKTALRAGGYAAPAVVSIATPIAAAAVSAPRIPILSAAPASGRVGTQFFFGGSGFVPNTVYDIALVSAPPGAQRSTFDTLALTANANGVLAGSGFSLTTFENGFFADPPGLYTAGVMPPTSMTPTATVSFTITATPGTGPDVPSIAISATSGPAGTAFVLAAAAAAPGITPEQFDLLLASAPNGAATGILTTTASTLGIQFGYVFDSTGRPTGTYIVQLVPHGSMTVLAQASFTIT